MAHPHQSHRAHHHEKDRVHHIAGHHASPKHYARGGHVHDDEAEDKAIIKKMVKKKALRADGGLVKARADKAPRRARGGHVKKGGKTNVNVIVAPHRGGAPTPGPMPGMAPPPPAAAAPPPMPPRPPMANPSQPPTAGLGGPGGMPPMPMRKRGGKVEASRSIKNHGTNALPGNKIKKGHLFGASNMAKLSHAKGDLYGDSQMKGYAKGGKVEGKKSEADKRGLTGIGERTPIQHSGNKSDTQNIGRGPVITRKTGGPIYANGKAGSAMAPNLHAGANSGVGRLKKNHMARREHWEA